MLNLQKLTHYQLITEYFYFYANVEDGLKNFFIGSGHLTPGNLSRTIVDQLDQSLTSDQFGSNYKMGEFHRSRPNYGFEEWLQELNCKE